MYLYFIHLVNANGLWISEMHQMIEIMHFSISIFVMGVSDTSSLGATQTSEWRYSQKNHDSFPAKKFAKSFARQCWSISKSWSDRQLLRLVAFVRGELVWNRSKMKRFEPEFLMKNSETCLFRDPEMSA
jgi:hypothetical protein